MVGFLRVHAEEEVKTVCWLSFNLLDFASPENFFFMTHAVRLAQPITVAVPVVPVVDRLSGIAVNVEYFEL